MCYIISLLTVFLFTGISGDAQDLPTTESLAQLKKESQIFESIVQEVLKQQFTHPYAIAGEPKATYLKGFGVSLSFHLRINRGTIRTFYREVESPLVNAPGTKSKQLQIVRMTMIETLADFGSTLKELDSGERIAICAHVEDRNELDTSKNRLIIALSVKKADIEQYVTKAISMAEFRKRVQILEY